MTTHTLSAFGLRLFTTGNLQTQQATLANLSQQLASNKKFNDLTDYTPLDAQNLLNLQNTITQRQSYVDGMKSVSARLSIYDTTLSDLEQVASQAGQLAVQNPNLDTDKVGIVQKQIVAYINQAVGDLNQQVGNRFIYAGTRYSTKPVDLDSVLTNFTPSATPVTANTLPSYDTAAPGTSAAAWTKDTATIDAGNTLTYGITSTETGIQQLMAGLEFINSATQTGVSAATYKTDMAQAVTLLNSALTNIQTIHAGVAANQNTVTSMTKTQNDDISSLKQQIGDIQSVDLAQVATEINALQTQLQASYSATAIITQDSILKYL